MTAHALVEEHRKVLDAGMNDVITKPIDLRAMFRTIDSHLPQRETAGPPHDGRSAGRSAVVVVPDILGVDVADALDSLDGNRELYLWIMKAFLENQAGTARDVEQAIADGDPALAQRLVHTARGIAGTIGAKEVFDAAAALEASIRDDDPPEMTRESLRHFGDQMAQLLVNVEKALALAGHAGTGGAGPGEATPQAGQVLNRLFRYIRENDGKAGHYLNENRSKLAALPREDVERLGACLSRFDYDTALAALGALAAKSGITLSSQDEGDIHER